jgi:hypothetical protein
MKVAVAMTEKLDGITGYCQNTKKDIHFNGIQKEQTKTGTGYHKTTRN